MSARDQGNAFYANDTRIARATWAGFQSSNTDCGVLYFTATVSGGNVTLSFYKQPTKGAGSLVASSNATAVSSTDWTSVSVTEENSSGLSATVQLDFTSSAASISGGKMIVSFSFDADFEPYEKGIANWALSDTWEGEGSAGCAFVRAHRFATNWAVRELRRRIASSDCVGLDGANLPDLFDVVLSMEEVRDAAVKYALNVIYYNQKNSGDVDLDPFAKSSRIMLADAQGAIESVIIHIDNTNDGKVDAEAKRSVMKWT